MQVNGRRSKDAARLCEMLCSRRQAAAMLKVGEISREDYDRRSYRYPDFDTNQRTAAVISQLSFCNSHYHSLENLPSAKINL